MKKYNYQEYCNKLNINKSYEAEPLEIILARVTETKEPISSASPIVYTDRNEGVKAEYNIRTDRFEVAREAMGAISRSKIAKRQSSESTSVSSGNTTEN